MSSLTESDYRDRLALVSSRLLQRNHPVHDGRMDDLLEFLNKIAPVVPKAPE